MVGALKLLLFMCVCIICCFLLYIFIVVARLYRFKTNKDARKKRAEISQE